MFPLGFCAGPIARFDIVSARAVRYAVASAVRFEVGLADNIKAHFITHINKFRRRRIMRSSYAVDVQGFHKREVFFQFFVALTPPAQFSRVVAVYPVKFDGNSVYEKFVFVGDLDFPKPDFSLDDFSLPREPNRVKKRLFRIPKNGFFRREREFFAYIAVKKQGVIFKNFKVRPALDRNGHAFAVRYQFKVSDMVFRSLQNIHVAKDSVVTECVLVFKITAAAPFQNLDRYGVFALGHKVGNVKFRLQTAALREPDISAVYIKKRAGANTLEYKIHAPEFFCDIESPTVYPARVVVWYERQVIRKRIIYVRIIGVSVTAELPTGRHGNFVPILYNFGNVCITLEICEIPFAVQKKIFGYSFRDTVTSRRHSVFACFFGVFVNSQIALS